MENFDVPMGAYDTAKVADLVGIYILNTLVCIVNLEQMGLYQDGGIIFTRTVRVPRLLGLRIQIASNLKIVDFFDFTLNLNNGTFKSFSKNKSAPTNVNIDSNFPRSLLKQIPYVMNQRINRLSLCKITFEETKRIYDESLKNSGFQGRLEYVNPVNSGSMVEVIVVGPAHPSR